MKKIKLKLDQILKYWNYFKFLRMKGILIFCQNLSLDAEKDLALSVFLKDQKFGWKNLNKDIVKKLINKTFSIKIKNFNNILLINDIINFKISLDILKKNKILVLGYYFQNYFFYKKDFNLDKIEKSVIFYNLKERVKLFFNLKINIISKLKIPIIKIILLLKKDIKK